MAGKNELWRSFGIRGAMFPVGVVTSRGRETVEGVGSDNTTPERLLADAELEKLALK